MKKVILFFFISLSLLVNAQINLVTNPSFEDTISCPSQAGDIDKAVGWTTLCNSPDYFKNCNQNGWGVPTNIFGYQIPASGNAYAGFISYSTFMTDLREFPACILNTPLNVGTKYYVSFKVVLSLENIANPTNCATNKIGAKFTTHPYNCYSHLTNNAPVFTNTVVTDTTNWTRITGSFIADSAYTYIVIGNFFYQNNFDTVKFFNSWWEDFSYYYLDDVCVGTDSIFVNGYSYDTGISDSKELYKVTFYPNPVSDHLFFQNSFNQAIEVAIYDILGNKLFRTNYPATKSFSIDLHDIPSGMLFINIKTHNQSVSYKLLKL